MILRKRAPRVPLCPSRYRPCHSVRSRDRPKLRTANGCGVTAESREPRRIRRTVDVERPSPSSRCTGCRPTGQPREDQQHSSVATRLMILRPLSRTIRMPGEQPLNAQCPRSRKRSRRRGPVSSRRIQSGSHSEFQDGARRVATEHSHHVQASTGPSRSPVGHCLRRELRGYTRQAQQSWPRPKRWSVWHGQ